MGNKDRDQKQHAIRMQVCLCVCVCVDHLHRCKTSFGCSRFSCFNIRFAGGTGPLWIPVPTKLFHNGGSGD